MQDTPAPAPVGPQPPETPFEPYVPADPEPWNARRIGHLRGLSGDLQHLSGLDTAEFP